MMPRTSHPRLLWNMSPSVPIGLYWLVPWPASPGQLAVIRLPDPIRMLADRRGYLPAGVLLMKPVAAGPGDVVCRSGTVVTVNGRAVARARRADAAGRPLPRWSGCTTLAPDRVFVLSPTPGSFDSRYFGPIDSASVVGTAHPVWVGEPAPPRQRGPPSTLRLPAPSDA